MRDAPTCPACGHYVTTVQLATVQQAVADYITEREQA